MNRTSKFIDALQNPRIGPSLGGVESLVEQPALMSFFELKTDERLAIGMSDGGTEGKAVQPNKVSLAC